MFSNQETLVTWYLDKINLFISPSLYRVNIKKALPKIF